MMTPEKRMSPAGNRGHSKKIQGGESGSSLPERDVLEAVNHGLYIVVVHIKSDGPTPRYRRHPYFGLAAAQRRVDRARQDGRDAYLLAYELRAAGWVGEASE